ncbi:hypothetical protein [Nodularia sphaerocarpa]|uniref:hypothetical protein n=1 Tax=Nodularia sphaerocarpa TaxID=137816 RepID=UPI001EFB7D1C|nr:hypothetical protein [Nodularia sphaerocarpa]MDB9374352.1 hypothetical protein [Nodularia sphaerocarpa CS-585]MDB9377397.1 hypothetical protein [Nodularia sphaerocarpa CS-585A2]ULP70390.1 hypothetical protein BDGGKGIB_00006 [Nodularia sphaerocarpa UHCC 0038]
MKSQKMRYQNRSQDSYIISLCICLIITIYLLQISADFFHWFLIPVILSGIIMGNDAINWLRGRLNIFDPVGILSLFGFHFFYLAPILHVKWNSWLEPWFPYPPDWRTWLGGMAILNFLGLLLYKFFKQVGLKKLGDHSSAKVWHLNHKRLNQMLPFFLIGSALLQIMVYRQFGGISNYINAATVSADEAGVSFEGMGILFMFSESFPILAMFGFAIYAQKHQRMQTWPVLLLVLIGFLVLTMFFGGLRGSRSNTIWALFWVAGIIHFWIRPLNKKHIAIGLVFLLLFMYLYGFLKGGGIEGLQQAITVQENRASLEAEYGRTWEGLLLGDLGRSDIQALLLYQMLRYDTDYDYAWGRTYFAALTILIPSAILPNKPPNKSFEGTEAAFGKGSYIPGKWVSSKVYGLAGEAMLNFSPFTVPLAFIPLGLLVGKIQKLFYSLKPGDTRLLIMPMLTNLCFVILVSDLDNNIFFLMKNSAVPCLFIFLVSHQKLSNCHSYKLANQ